VANTERAIYSREGRVITSNMVYTVKRFLDFGLHRKKVIYIVS